MSWPAWWYQERAGTCYVSANWFPRLIEKYSYRGQAWQFRGNWTTYRPDGDICFKALERLKTTGEADFWRIMDCCESVGLEPPTSFGDIFLHAYWQPFPQKGIISPFQGRAFGGWQAVNRPGLYTKEVWHYDIIKAYRWAALQGLPDLKSAYRTQDGTHPHAIYLFDLPAGAFPWIKHDGIYCVTSEERDAMQKRPKTTIYGIAFKGKLDISRVFDYIDTHFPYCTDRISRSFWGLWNGTSGPDHVTWKGGRRIRRMQNPFYNPVWAAFITSRVKLKLLEHWDKSLHCFVDSLLMTEPIPEGTGVGDFRLVDRYSTVWVEGPGIWGTGDILIKHAGRK